MTGVHGVAWGPDDPHDRCSLGVDVTGRCFRWKMRTLRQARSMSTPRMRTLGHSHMDASRSATIWREAACAISLAACRVFPGRRCQTVDSRDACPSWPAAELKCISEAGTARPVVWSRVHSRPQFMRGCALHHVHQCSGGRGVRGIPSVVSFPQWEGEP
jgi:hypothetical protein